jgi:hypothetical protein
MADLTPKEQEAMGMLQRTPAHWARVTHFPAPPGEGHRDGWGIECQACDYSPAPFLSFEEADDFARQHEAARLSTPKCRCLECRNSDEPGCAIGFTADTGGAPLHLCVMPGGHDGDCMTFEDLHG